MRRLYAAIFIFFLVFIAGCSGKHVTISVNIAKSSPAQRLIDIDNGQHPPFVASCESCNKPCAACTSGTLKCVNANQPMQFCAECLLSTNCKLSYICLNFTCLTHESPYQGTECQTNADCDAASFCDKIAVSRSRCVKRSLYNEFPDCSADFKCTGACANCVSGAQKCFGINPPDGGTVGDSRCRDCSVDTDCKTGFTCDFGHCIAP